MHTVLCAAGYNLRWLLRAMVRLGLKGLLLRPEFVGLLAAILQRLALPNRMGANVPAYAALRLESGCVK